MSEQLIQYLTPIEIAHTLNCHPKTVLAWLRDPSHPLKGVKIGNMWRVDPNDFAVYLRGLQQQ